MRYAAFILLALAVAACEPAEQKSSELAAPAEPLVWPQPPAQPRIRFAYAFRVPDDLDIGRPFLGRLWELIVGEAPRHMIRPYGVAAEGETVAVADPGAGVVHLYDMGAKSYKRITEAGDEILISPVGVALTPDRIYLADSGLGKVFAFDRDRDLVVTIGDVERPTGIVYEPETERLYVAETLAHGISVFDREGRRLFAFGGRGERDGAFNYPTHLSIWQGRLYVNDTMNFRVQTFDLEGNHLSTFGSHGDGSGDFAQPKGVALDALGNVYVVDALFNRVQVFDGEGKFLLGFGGTGGRIGRFWLPSGLFIADNRIYVADSYNRRIQVFEFLGGA